MGQIRKIATNLLNYFYGENSKFRNNQLDSIESIFKNKKTLVIQRTGWGKSLLYLIATKINRAKRKGVTLVISPLLSLINNQIDIAKKFDLKCESITSEKSSEEKEKVIDKIRKDFLDIVFTTPESLNTILKDHIETLDIGMIVLDEAHCISEWGHDFRLSYRKIKDIIPKLEHNVPILCTTATANDKVIKDLKEQIGEDLYIIRGRLDRKNISIFPIEIPDKVTRYAWILENIPKFEGTGVIYCLTKADCDKLSKFLNENGIRAKSYHSEVPKEKEPNILYKFNNNEIKVLVTTTKLSMGYDKPDVSFMIHFQPPKNIISYYQQVGRIGRDMIRVPSALSVIMHGNIDMDIIDYLNKDSFPQENEMRKILEIIDNENDIANNGLTQGEIIKKSQHDKKTVKKCLKFLKFEGYIYEERNKIFRINFPEKKEYIYKKEYYEKNIENKEKEKKEMYELFDVKSCLSKYILSHLDKDFYKDCGLCSNCRSMDFSVPTESIIRIAKTYIESLEKSNK